MKQNDTDRLLRDVGDGSHEAFGEFYRLFFRKCFYTAQYYLDDTSLIEDVVADVFLNLWNRREALRGIRDIESFLYISVRNQAMRYSRRSKRSYTHADEPELVNIECSDLSPEEAVMKEQFDTVLQQAMDTLPAKSRMVYCMVREERLSYKQISAMLGISERTINTHMTTAISRLVAAMRRHLSAGDS